MVNLGAAVNVIHGIRTHHAQQTGCPEWDAPGIRAALTGCEGSPGSVLAAAALAAEDTNLRKPSRRRAAQPLARQCQVRAATPAQPRPLPRPRQPPPRLPRLPTRNRPRPHPRGDPRQRRRTPHTDRPGRPGTRRPTRRPTQSPRRRPRMIATRPECGTGYGIRYHLAKDEPFCDLCTDHVMDRRLVRETRTLTGARPPKNAPCGKPSTHSLRCSTSTTPPSAPNPRPRRSPRSPRTAPRRDP